MTFMSHNLMFPPRISKILHKLRLHCLHFLLDKFFAEEGIDEESGEYFQTFQELGRVYLVVVKGCVVFGPSVGGSCILADKIGIIIVLRILMTAHEEHMFQKMCQALSTLRIIITTCTHLHHHRTLTNIKVLNKDYFEFVF